LVTYGHSFLAETGLANPADYYARRIAAEFDMQYPTNTNGGVNKRAVGGSFAESAADVMLTGNPWLPDKRHVPNKVLLFQDLINAARKNGADPATRQGAEHALRTMCACAGWLETNPDYAARCFDCPPGWAGATSPAFHSGRYEATSTPGAYVEF